MRRGRANAQLVFETNTPTRSSSGEAIAGWSAYKTVWGELNQVSGGEAFRSRQVHASADSVFEFDWIDAPDVTTAMRATYGSRVFDVLMVNNIANRNRRVRVDLRERGR